MKVAADALSSSLPPLPPPAALPRIAELMLPRQAEVVDRSMGRIRQEIAFFSTTDVVTDDELRRSLTSNLEYIIDSIVEGGDLDLRAPERTGRARAAQRVPLADVLACSALVQRDLA